MGHIRRVHVLHVHDHHGRLLSLYDLLYHDRDRHDRVLPLFFHGHDRHGHLLFWHDHHDHLFCDHCHVLQKHFFL